MAALGGLREILRDFDFDFDFDFKFGIVGPGLEGGVARFDPEKMASYRVAREHSRAVHEMLQQAETRGFSDLVGQLYRSAASIPANILEATGEWRAGKRLNYLMIAKGSAWESWAHTDTLIDFGLVQPRDTDRVRGLQEQITALLITTIRRLEQDVRKGNGAATRGGTLTKPPPSQI
jgi:four helix bundle protein